MTQNTLGIQRVHRRIGHLKQEMIGFLGEFCSIATVNPPGDNYSKCVQFLERKLKSLHMTTRIVRPPLKEQLRLVPGSEKYPRPSVIGRWDVGAKRTLLLTGHYDVVPATGGWKIDPFKLKVQRNRLIARGVSDMKGSNTAAIFVIQAMQETKFTPPWNIEFAFTPDEETGGYAGLGYLARSGQFDADAAILLEGGGDRGIGYAHRGVLWLKITVSGKAAHASNPRDGINALEKALPLIQRLKTLEAVYAKRPSAFLTDKPATKRPTIMIGGICGGGSKINTIPDRFSFTIDRRLRPEDKVQEVKAEILAVIRAAQRHDHQLEVKVEYPLHVPPGWTNQDAGICKVAKEAVRSVIKKTPQFRMTGGFTDMHFLTQDCGIPTVGYGAYSGKAHGDHEFLTTSELMQTAKVYAEIIGRLKN